jgi:hypothetical protein
MLLLMFIWPHVDAHVDTLELLQTRSGHGAGRPSAGAQFPSARMHTIILMIRFCSFYLP